MPKPHITRTYGQIHFEDLDPKRFEDLIRELIYDYKDWQNIEATGRGGSDDGFDIRAFEKQSIYTTSENKNGDDIDTVRVAEGNLWMVQGKREQVLGPKRIKEILKDVDSKKPPYGYILAASANFSKVSYDLFRSELQSKGVMEFHLWGKAELEDMLHQPKNDRILFTYFGISLVSKRRTRATEIRTNVINKNKIINIFGEKTGLVSVLLRDSSDTKYPYKKEYIDFSKNPRWKEYSYESIHPLGLLVNMYKHFAYIDHQKKEYDFVSDVCLIHKFSESESDRSMRQVMIDNIQDFWLHMPKANQTYFHKEGLLRFDDMLVIDAKGDSLHEFPHVYTDFGTHGPFSGFLVYAKNSNNTHFLDGYKRISFFPKKFRKPKEIKFIKDKEVVVEKAYQYRLSHHNELFDTIYETDGRYKFLKVRDAIGIQDPDDSSRKNYIEITYKESKTVRDYLLAYPNKEFEIQSQLGRTPDPNEIINAYEFKRAYDYRLS